MKTIISAVLLAMLRFRIGLAVFVMVSLGLNACGKGGVDYDVSARCQDKGTRPGTVEYDRCLKDEKLDKIMEEQRHEFERMQQERQDQMIRRY